MRKHKNDLIRLAAVAVALIINYILLSSKCHIEIWAALILVKWFLWFTFVMFCLALLADIVETKGKL